MPAQQRDPGKVNGDIVIALHIAREDEVKDGAIAKAAQAHSTA